jgi:hypothetical protein
MLKTIKLVLVCLPQEYLVPLKPMKYWAENGINIVSDESFFLNIAVEDFFVRQFVNSKITKLIDQNIDHFPVFLFSSFINFEKHNL